MSSSPPATSPRPLSEKISEPVVATAEVQPSIIDGYLAGNRKIVVDETRFQDELRTKGFGEKENTEFILKPYEALYLFYIKRLKLKNRPAIGFNSLLELLLKHNRNIMSEFLVYRDLRSRGYVVKEGFGFGNDFRVYERGDYEKKPAKYVVFGINEGTNTKAKEFASAVSQIQKMGKEAVVAVIERRGEVIYYKASTIHFTDNNNYNNNPVAKTIDKILD
ncbi:MAG: tRNA-intron lyase [Thermoproteota archaeon]|nr:tRNA-intron lyase [Thermoproteota archaeon]